MPLFDVKPKKLYKTYLWIHSKYGGEIYTAGYTTSKKKTFYVTKSQYELHAVRCKKKHKAIAQAVNRQTRPFVVGQYPPVLPGFRSKLLPLYRHSLLRAHSDTTFTFRLTRSPLALPSTAQPCAPTVAPSAFPQHCHLYVRRKFQSFTRLYPLPELLQLRERPIWLSVSLLSGTIPRIFSFPLPCATSWRTLRLRLLTPSALPSSPPCCTFINTNSPSDSRTNS